MTQQDTKLPTPGKILALSGSLRRESVHLAICQAAQELGRGVTVLDPSVLAQLPAFCPDWEDTSTPALETWRTHTAQAGAVLLACPEYAHGIPGALKNALDWLVGSGELMDKRVLIVTASANSQYIGPALHEVLKTMNARPQAITLGLPRQSRAADILANGAATQQLQRGLKWLRQIEMEQSE